MRLKEVLGAVRARASLPHSRHGRDARVLHEPRHARPLYSVCCAGRGQQAAAPATCATRARSRAPTRPRGCAPTRPTNGSLIHSLVSSYSPEAARGEGGALLLAAAGRRLGRDRPLRGRLGGREELLHGRSHLRIVDGWSCGGQWTPQSHSLAPSPATRAADSRAAAGSRTAGSRRRREGGRAWGRRAGRATGTGDAPGRVASRTGRASESRAL